MLRTTPEMLTGTPYLIEEDSESEAQFRRLLDNSVRLADDATRVGERIQREAAEVFESFGITMRSELVAESNQIEHYDWTPSAVRELVINSRDLLEQPAHVLLAGMRGDDHAWQALGLYKAQLVADEWAERQIRPREMEIRQLHALITNGEVHAGRYKYSFNEISGAVHVPPAPADAAEGMHHLAQWLEHGTGDPSLDATVVHAWLVHLHPFEDGNGRLARLLANLALSQGGHPPLILSAASDRGEYYDALASSDDGNVLPLFDLFGRVMRRTVRTMSSPDYVETVIRDRSLVSASQQRQLWQQVAERFAEELRQRLRAVGWDTIPQGYPNDSSFGYLSELSADGNSWFLKVRSADSSTPWLLWFGYNSDEFREVYGDKSGYPSVFFSTRSAEPGAPHPFTPVKGFGAGGDGSELVLCPGRAKPAHLQEGYSWNDLTIEEAAERVARTVCG